MHVLLVIFWGVLAFLFLVTPGIPAKVFYKNTNDKKKAYWHLRTKVGIIFLIIFAMYFIKYIY